jgi:hypothetical protein
LAHGILSRTRQHDTTESTTQECGHWDYQLKELGIDGRDGVERLCDENDRIQHHEHDADQGQGQADTDEKLEPHHELFFGVFGAWGSIGQDFRGQLLPKCHLHSPRGVGSGAVFAGITMFLFSLNMRSGQSRLTSH